MREELLQDLTLAMAGRFDELRLELKNIAEEAAQEELRNPALTVSYCLDFKSNQLEDLQVFRMQCIITPSTCSDVR